jgi:hypothetical protein
VLPKNKIKFITIFFLFYTSNVFIKSIKPPYGKRFFSCGNLSFGGKNGTGSRGANNASKFGGRNCVIFELNLENINKIHIVVFFLN